MDMVDTEEVTTDMDEDTVDIMTALEWTWPECVALRNCEGVMYTVDMAAVMAAADTMEVDTMEIHTTEMDTTVTATTKPQDYILYLNCCQKMSRNRNSSHSS